MKNFKLLAVLFVFVAMHLDDSALKKMNMSKDDYKGFLVGEFKKSFVESAGLNFSE